MRIERLTIAEQRAIDSTMARVQSLDELLDDPELWYTAERSIMRDVLQVIAAHGPPYLCALAACALSCGEREQPSWRRRRRNDE